MPDTRRHDGEWIAPDRVFDGERLQRGMAVKIIDGRIVDVDHASGKIVRRLRGLLTPGFVDLQVNGGGGVLLNQTPTPQGMLAIATAHRQFGTVAILPTVITDAADVLARAAEAAVAAKGLEGVVGLHIEGPHISTTRRGTHAKRFVRPMDDATLDIVQGLREQDVAVMITVAPEAVTQAQIAELSAIGAIVSLGHSDASAEETDRALEAGAVCFTHLFNAMPPLVNRAPGMAGAAINSTAFAGIICDGVHVDDTVVGMAIRARLQPDTTFLVSDAMPTVGGGDRFMLYGQELRLKDGRLVNDEGSLAGAHVTMAASVARLVTVLGFDPEVALRMAITVPAKVMRLKGLAEINGRRIEDILVLNDHMDLQSTLAQEMNAPSTVL